MSAMPHITELETVVDDGLAQLISAARERCSELEREKRSIEREISACLVRLQALENAQRSLTGNGPHLHVATSSRGATKREAVLAYLSESPGSDVRLVTIRRSLIERGWMTDDQNSIHALEVAVIAMERRGELLRTRKGYYALKPEGPAAQPEMEDLAVIELDRAR